MPLCTILIPTWNAPDTIEDAVASALRQTVSDIEVLIVGDGVTDAAREAIARCVAADARVRFLDLPKGENRGERNRHIGVLEAAGPVVAYLGDDDLLLPRHVAHVLAMLETVDFCQTLNGFIDARGEVVLWPTDLSDERWREWHLQDPPRNRVSITGTAHTLDSYRRLDRGWDVAPPGVWTDLHLWRQFFRLPGLTAATHPEMTTIQIPSAALRTMSPEEIASARRTWVAFASDPHAHEELQAKVREAARRQLIASDARVTDLLLTLEAERSRRDDAAATAADEWANRVAALEAALTARVLELEKEARDLRAERDAALAAVDAMRKSTSWRVAAPLRALRRRP